jgi:molybdopterin/thiamine biosynthesis adenylyltransferase
LTGENALKMPHESPRYARIDYMPALNHAGIHQICKKAAIVGCGNIGTQLANQLNMMEIQILLVDHDFVSLSNLGSQDFLESDIGKAKVLAKARMLHEMNPANTIVPMVADIRLLGPGHFLDCQVVFSCLDNWQGRSVLRDICWQLGIPLVDAAMDGTGTRLFGRVSIFDFRHGKTACPFCTWSAGTIASIRAQQNAHSACPIVQLGPQQSEAPPTLQPGSMGAILAGFQCIESLKLLSQKQAGSTAFEILLDLTGNTYQKIPLKLSKNCLFLHKRRPITILEYSTSAITVAELMQLAADEMAAKEVHLTLQGKQLAAELACEQGHVVKDLNKVVETYKDETRCPKCGEHLMPVVARLQQRLSRASSGSFAGKTWAELGVPDKDMIIAESAKQSRAYIFA